MPRVRSAIGSRINYRIEICAELRGIDRRSPPSSIGNHCARYEASSPNGPQLCDRRTVAADDKRAPRLYFTQHGG